MRSSFPRSCTQHDAQYNVVCQIAWPDSRHTRSIWYRQQVTQHSAGHDVGIENTIGVGSLGCAAIAMQAELADLERTLMAELKGTSTVVSFPKHSPLLFYLSACRH